jgi:superfamily II DNA/RNA helicase
MNTNQSFESLTLPEPLKSALLELGFKTLTPIQSATLLPALRGRDVLGSSQTGTGKTAAYAIPLLSWLYANPGRQGLVLAPTRELATQIHKVLRQMGKSMGLKGSLVLGGESFSRQKIEVTGDADYLVATPGRLGDHLTQGSFTLRRISVLVFDEVDLMMDMGFAPQIKAIARQAPKERQTLFFSATLPSSILSLAEKLLNNPVRATVGLTHQPVAEVNHVNQRLSREQKPIQLVKEVSERQGRILVFTRTKLNTEWITKLLKREGHSVDFLHGERTQAQRREALKGFREGRCRILVATDLAARGLDIHGIEHVINYHLPQSREEYIHRVGRTGRHGKTGIAVNFITPKDRDLIRTYGNIMGMEEVRHEISPPKRFPARRPASPPARKG